MLLAKLGDSLLRNLIPVKVQLEQAKEQLKQVKEQLKPARIFNAVSSFN